MAAQQQMSPAQLNAIARAAIRARAIYMEQPIFSSTFNPTTQPTVTIIPRNIGLVLGFWVKVVHSISNGSLVQINATDFGPANALSQIQFNDLQNVTRIQTPGWHMAWVNSVKTRRPFGSALVRTTGIATGPVYGNVFTTGQIGIDATIAAAGTGTVTMWYYVPLAYNMDDLRGVVYGNVTNTTMQLLLSMPGQFGNSIAVANGTDSTNALFVGNAAGAVTAVTITSTTLEVYQCYYDQLPVGPQGLLLPVTDLGTIYELKQSTLTAITAGQDFGYQYPNFRDILSTTPVYVNTAATGARTGGTDINYWALQAANTTNIWKKKPDLQVLQTRNFFTTDFPLGVYYFGSRQRPISTTQYGNQQLIINASTAGAGAYLMVGIEDFALVQTLSMAGSLATS